MIGKPEEMILKLMPGAEKKGLIGKILAFKRNVENKRKASLKSQLQLPSKSESREESIKTKKESPTAQPKLETPARQADVKKIEEDEADEGEESPEYIVYND